MREGSKILNNSFKDIISTLHNLDFLAVKEEDVCRSGYRFGIGLNRQEVTVVPKKLIKKGFFEKFFHIFS